MARHTHEADVDLPPTLGVRNARVEVQMILAVDGHGVLGNDGQLPWYSPQDMRNFRQATANLPVIVGRITWEDIVRRSQGRPILPTRTPIIMTRKPDYYAPGQLTADSREQALELADQHGDGQVVVIGGASVYELFAPVTSTIFMTRIPGCHPGDTFMNRDWLRGFRVVDWAMHPDPDEPLEFMTFHRWGWPPSTAS